MFKRVRKAVFPVAGLGTRFLPATKTVPKEMLPVVDKPLIQYAVDEAIEAGCDTMVFVTNRYKHAVADYFDKAYELEQKLEKSGKTELLAIIRDVLPSKVRAVVVTQAEALGLGPAVLCARPVVGDEPFAVLLPDDLIWNKGAGALRQMTDLAAAENASVIAVQDVPRQQTGIRHRRDAVFSAVMARSKPSLKSPPGGCSQHAGGGRSLRAQPADLRSARAHARRRGRRNPADRWHRGAAAA